MLHAQACIFWKSVFKIPLHLFPCFSCQVDSVLKWTGFISNWKFPDCVHFFGEQIGQVWQDNSHCVRTHEKNSESAVCRLDTIIQIKAFFVPNQEPAFGGLFGNGLVRVGTQGLFRPCLKTFVAVFLPTRLTAPGSLRMGKSSQRWIWSSKKVLWSSFNWTFVDWF